MANDVKKILKESFRDFFALFENIGITPRVLMDCEIKQTGDNKSRTASIEDALVQYTKMVMPLKGRIFRVEVYQNVIGLARDTEQGKDYSIKGSQIQNMARNAILSQMREDGRLDDSGRRILTDNEVSKLNNRIDTCLNDLYDSVHKERRSFGSTEEKVNEIGRLVDVIETSKNANTFAIESKNRAKRLLKDIKELESPYEPSKLQINKVITIMSKEGGRNLVHAIKKAKDDEEMATKYASESTTYKRFIGDKVTDNAAAFLMKAFRDNVYYPSGVKSLVVSRIKAEINENGDMIVTFSQGGGKKLSGMSFAYEMVYVVNEAEYEDDRPTYVSTQVDD